MNNEQRMWVELMSNANADWQCHLGNVDVGAGALQQECAIYVVDATTGWLVGGTLSHSHFLHAADTVRAATDAHHEVMGIAKAIHAAGQRPGEIPRADMEAFVGGAVQALALTRTFDVVRSSRDGSLAGHWLYLAYGLKDGSFLGRPSYRATRTRGLLPVSDLHDWIATTVDLDVRGSGSVSQMIARGGGTTISPAFLL